MKKILFILAALFIIVSCDFHDIKDCSVYYILMNGKEGEYTNANIVIQGVDIQMEIYEPKIHIYVGRGLRDRRATIKVSEIKEFHLKRN